MANETVRATGYVVVEGRRSRYYPDNGVESARLVAVKQNKPTTLTGDQVAIKVTIELPKAAFEALRPEALIVVPEELIQHEVQVEAVEP
jgi:hypothetical protein